MLGTIRTLWIVPRLGTRMSELIETPIAENSLKWKGYFMTASNGSFLRWAGTLMVLFFFTPVLAQQDSLVRVIAFGAHPDDCDLSAGGLAAKYATLGYKVKFVSVTNGDAGNQSQSGETLATRRRAEAKEAGRRIGIEYDSLPFDMPGWGRFSSGDFDHAPYATSV